MGLAAEWTFEGGPEPSGKQGPTETTTVIFVAYMLVYEKRTSMEVNLSGTADLLIRLKYVFRTYLGLFYV